MRLNVSIVMMMLVLLMIGCASGTGSFCPQDKEIQPTDAEIDAMQQATLDALALRIADHDEHHKQQCR